VVVTGNVDRIEIWDPAVFDRTVESAGSDEGLTELDFQIFG
jgi:DNA-binding transcriptional regulator/RsmH inhibitor MraZ